jgi:hypothetical protein
MKGFETLAGARSSTTGERHMAVFLIRPLRISGFETLAGARSATTG